MGERELIELAVSRIEDHLDVLGRDVVMLSVSALHEKLAALPHTATPTPFFFLSDEKQITTENVTVLVARLLDGATGLPLAVEQQATAVSGARRLFGHLVQRWGGVVMPQPDNWLVALFGLDGAVDSASQRAVWAALALQTELAVWQAEWEVEGQNGRLQIRVGLHQGDIPLDLLADTSSGSFWGQTMHLAQRLEQAAPAGGHLLSYAVYQSVSRYFEVEPLPLPPRSDDNGSSASLQTVAYQVVGRKKIGFWQPLRSNGMIPRLIGREAEQQQLQHAFEQVVQQQHAHLVTVTGQVGVGKSHLLYHFEQWLNLASVPVLLLRGRVKPGWVQWPQPPLGHLFASLLNLSLLDSKQVLQHKIRTGLARYLPEANVATACAVVEQWLDLSPVAAGGHSPAHWLMVLVRLLRGVVSQQSAVEESRSPQAVVLLLEDLHEADELSINFVEALFRQCRDLPLLLIGSAQPTLHSKRPSWPTDIPAEQQSALKLPPLSAIDTRHLISEFLPHLSPVPLRLYEVLVAAARGNPLYIREAIRLLQLEGSLKPSEPLWLAARLDEVGVSHVVAPYRGGPLTLPDSLPALFERQVTAVSPLAHAVLQKAALVGYWFWDTAVAYLNQQQTNAPNNQLSPITAVLQALVVCGLVRQQPFPIYWRAKGYMFCHPLMRQVLYEQISHQQRQYYQQQIEQWRQQFGEQTLIALPNLITSRESIGPNQPVPRSMVD